MADNPRPWENLTLIPVDRYLSEAWNTFTKGRHVDGPITILADADIFEAFSDSMVHMKTLIPDTTERQEPSFCYFRTARMYKLANRGWKVRFVAQVSQEFTYGG